MRQHKTNLIIRVGIAELGLRNWQAAERLGITEGYFSTRIRKELPLKKQLEILEKIREGSKWNEKP